MRPRTPDVRSRGRARLRRSWPAALPVLLVLAACTQELPQNSLAPAGPVAQKQADLFFLVFWIATGVFVIVEGLLVFALWRFRRRGDDDTPVQVHGNTRLEVAWTIIPALLLAGVAVPTISSIFDLSRPVEGAIQIDVVGHQWWWEVRYPQQDGIGEEFVTANEIHIPVDTPVQLNLSSDEASDARPVIHSFWVPRLAGKQDMIPGQTTTLTIEASVPGTYQGQCAEYCGLSHYLMRVLVVAETEEEFSAWAEGQAQPAAEPAEGSEEAEGQEIFRSPLPQGTGTCIACHAVEGIEGAAATVGPSLTHIGSRQTVASGVLPNTEDGLRQWLQDPSAVKPGARMPNYRLTDDQLDALIAYLLSLK